MGAVAYLGFPAPGGKLSVCAPTQPVHGSIDAKNELGIKGRRKVSRAVQSLAYKLFLDPSENFLWLWRHRINIRTFESGKSLNTVELAI